MFMNKRLLKRIYFSQFLNPAILLVRVWIGIVMLRYSTQYLFGGKVHELASFLEGLHWPMPLQMAYLSQITELIASILILLGVRLGAYMLAFTMLMAVLFAHNALIFTEAETPFSFLMFAMMLCLTGMGKPSLDNSLFMPKQD